MLMPINFLPSFLSLHHFHGHQFPPNNLPLININLLSHCIIIIDELRDTIMPILLHFFHFWLRCRHFLHFCFLLHIIITPSRHFPRHHLPWLRHYFRHLYTLPSHWFFITPCPFRHYILMSLRHHYLMPPPFSPLLPLIFLIIYYFHFMPFWGADNAIIIDACLRWLMLSISALMMFSFSFTCISAIIIISLLLRHYYFLMSQMGPVINKWEWSLEFEWWEL